MPSTANWATPAGRLFAIQSLSRRCSSSTAAPVAPGESRGWGDAAGAAGLGTRRGAATTGDGNSAGDGSGTPPGGTSGVGASAAGATGVAAGANMLTVGCAIPADADAEAVWVSADGATAMRVDDSSRASGGVSAEAVAPAVVVASASATGVAVDDPLVPGARTTATPSPNTRTTRA